MNCNVKEKSTPFTLNGRTYDLKVTFWVEAELYERFGGGVESALKGRRALKNILVIMMLLINEAVGIHNEAAPGDPWEEIDERYIGRHLTNAGAEALLNAIMNVFQLSRPEVREDELTDEEKNGEASR